MNKFEIALQFILDNIPEESEFYQNVYLVGGCVRDELLGIRFTDLDLLINLPDGQKKFVEYMCEKFPKECRGPFYYKRYGTTAMDVRIDDNFVLVECVEPHIEEYNEDGTELINTHFCSLEEDAKRRDFTCNALYKNLHTGEILDPTGLAIQDINNRYLRTPGDPYEIFKQDPVRMLRGIRFKRQKKFRLDQEAWNAIVALHENIVYSTDTRMREEIHKMIKCKDISGAFYDLYKSGMMAILFPGMEKYMSKDVQLSHIRSKYNLWTHTYTALEIQVSEHPHTPSAAKLAVLFADIALLDGIDTVKEFFNNYLLSKEKINTTLLLLQYYVRLKTLFFKGEYLGTKATTLPRMIRGLGSQRNDFRRLVRALNHGMKANYYLPYKLFFDNAVLPVPNKRGTQIRKARGITLPNKNM
ncbi:MAG: CCA tRNA nucleotidyltransferase [Bacteroidales bacterium]|nr:CCA tRNA nucleotidyltransferase [Bacteroidales bacterium]